LPEYTEEGLKIAAKFNYQPILIKKIKVFFMVLKL
jgi:hypothetical protein